MPSSPPVRIPTPDPQCSCDLHEPPRLELPLLPPDVVPTARYRRRAPETEPFTDEEPTEPGTPPPPLAAGDVGVGLL
jgi:hypothetical protein